MKLLISLLVSQLFLIGQNLIGQDVSSLLDEIPKYPLRATYHFCLSEPQSLIAKVQFVYNEKNILIETLAINTDSSYKDKTEFKYNDAGLLSTMINSRGSNTVFVYDSASRLIYEGCENQNHCVEQKNYVYNSKGQLVRKKISGTGWGVEYVFEYDTQGRLIKKYKDNKLKFSYDYLQDYLVKEIEYHYEGTTEITYQYDKFGFIISKKIEGKEMERNVYDSSGKIIEKRITNMDRDPCSTSPCCGNKIIKYEYY
jgi:hypothetical protein